jgi:thioredoxin-related protein
VSAFADVEMSYEPKEESKHNDIKEPTDMTSMAVEWRNKYIHMAVDYKAVQMYFKKLKDLINNEKEFREAIGELIMAIEHTWDYAKDTKNDKHAGQERLMCVRGVLMLFHLEDLEDYVWQETSERLGDLFYKFY